MYNQANRYFALVPRSGFALTTWNCSGTYRADFGSVEERDGMVVTRSAVRPDVFGAQLDGDLVPVRWGNTHLLVERYRLIDFCNDINSGNFVQGDESFYLTRIGDDPIPAGTLPTIPAAYEQCLLRQPLSAWLLTVDTRTRRAHINAGSRRGVFVGMQLWSCESWASPARERPRAVVRLVRPEHAQVEITWPYPEWRRPDSSFPERGSRMSSREDCPLRTGS